MEGIVDAFDTQLPRMHTCTVRYTGGHQTGLLDVPITIILNKDGTVKHVKSPVTVPEGDDALEMRQRWLCLERTLRGMHFPPSRGRTTLSLLYHSFMPSVNSMPGTPTEPLSNASD